MFEIDRQLYSAAAVRAAEQRAIDLWGLSAYSLMQSAAQACWNALRERWPDAKAIGVICGGGNNGGDGYELACLAHQDGRVVVVFDVASRKPAETAAIARDAWCRRCDAYGSLIEWRDGALLALAHCDVLVDAIFGTGLARPPEGREREAIEVINRLHAAGIGVLAVDISSGLSADHGNALGIAVQADVTATFIGRKVGLHTGEGPRYAGRVVFEPLALHEDCYEKIEPLAGMLNQADLRRWLPPRARTAHKGDSGHVLIIGGDHGTTGAVLLCARAALRAGAGLVSVATRAGQTQALTAAQPELMCHAVESAEDLQPLLQRASVVAIGPGLGQGAWGRAMLAVVDTVARPLVADADALNLLAQAAYQNPLRVITPHPGEAARLLGIDTRAVQADRLAAARALQEKYAGVAVLKGAGTLVCGEQMQLCPYGNPGMGVGGMGDALTGIVAAFIAQKLPPEDAANAAVLAHALAGDRAAINGERGLLPSDLIECLRAVVNP